MAAETVDSQARRRGLKLDFSSSQRSLSSAGSSVSPGSASSAGPPTSLSMGSLHLSSSMGNFHPPGQVLASMGAQTQIERLRSQSLQSTGKLKFGTDLVFDFTAEDLVDQGEIGRGAYGTVNKMYHEQSHKVMAVKRIRSTVDEKEQKQLLMDLDVVVRSADCPHIVQFFGALFKEGDCWICMEVMSVSLDKFYKFVNIHLAKKIPEEIIGKITLATLKALSYLKDKLKIIHRDVKPSNILMDKSGNIKLCDFGISGQLVDSIAKTRDAGCRPYMAPERIEYTMAEKGYDTRSDVWSVGITLPERIDPRVANKGYDVRSDVWSLGITLIEVATGKFPYPKWNSVFDQLTQVVQGEPPHFQDNDDRYSHEFKSFVNICLMKDYHDRPKYRELLKYPFIRRSEAQDINVGGYVTETVDQMPDKFMLNESSNS